MKANWNPIYLHSVPCTLVWNSLKCWQKQSLFLPHTVFPERCPLVVRVRAYMVSCCTGWGHGVWYTQIIGWFQHNTAIMFEVSLLVISIDSRSNSHRWLLEFQSSRLFGLMVNSWLTSKVTALVEELNGCYMVKLIININPKSCSEIRPRSTFSMWNQCKHIIYPPSCKNHLKWHWVSLRKYFKVHILKSVYNKFNIK